MKEMLGEAHHAQVLITSNFACSVKTSVSYMTNESRF